MSLRSLAPTILAFAIALPCLSQVRRLTANDYERAEKFMGYITNPLVLHAPARQVWLSDDRFWYRVNTEKGTEFILVDPSRGTRGPAFDQGRGRYLIPANLHLEQGDCHADHYPQLR